MTIRTLIIDDEQANIDNLQTILERFFPEVEVLDTAHNAAFGLEIMLKHRPDLVFLDVEMPDKTGLELLRDLGSIDFEVVFVTAHEHYAVTAFRLSALDYLLKPIDLNDLEACIQKVKARTGEKQRLQHLEQFVQHFSPGGQQEKKIPIPTAERLVFVSLQEIIRCEGHLNYTTFHFDSGEKIVVSKTLKEYESMLREYDFIRVHQSHLANIQHIDRYEKRDGGYLVMSDKSNLPVARGRKEFILSRLSEF